MQNYTILYAEDEEQTRQNYTNYLSRYFKEVYSCQDGLQAYETYIKNKPDILLLDINMPKLNGLELAKKIRVIDKKSRIIILTAHLEKDKLLFAAELNLTKYLPKPISRIELKDALKQAIEQIEELSPQINTSTLSFSQNIFWDKKTNILYNDKEEVKLTRNEILLLELLSSKANNIFSLYDISFYLWEDWDDLDVESTKLKDIIKRLRKKLPKDSITNIYGAGYKLNVYTSV